MELRNPPANRCDSWKEIAAYLKRGVRTVQRWEREAALPVHRLPHQKLGSVYAYTAELDSWWTMRGAQLADAAVSSSPAQLASIAVLPFADMSAERNQRHLCEGVAEEIIHRLAAVRSIRVASRSSSFRFPAPAADIASIGRRLSVSHLLEGSVRTSGDRLRINVRLVAADTGYELWSGQFEGRISDVFAIEDQLAHKVADALEVALSPKESAALGVAPTADLRAYDCYLRGRQYYYQFGAQDMDCAVQMFMQAIQLDPKFARAYAGLADCWSYIYIYANRSDAVREQADWASRKALELDPQSAQALASRAFSLGVAGREGEAEEAFEAAIRLDPGLYEAHYYYARFCFAHGRPERALHYYERAMAASPLEYQPPLLCAQIFDDLGRAVEARDIRRRGIDLALEHIRQQPDDTRAMYMAANGYAALGQHAEARELTRRAVALRPQDPMLLYNAGCIYSMLGEIEEALDCLDAAARTGLTEKGWYEHDSNLAAVRSHPRFTAILALLDEGPVGP